MGDWRRVLHEHGPQKATCRPDAPTLPDGNASSAHWTARITDRNTISRKCRTGQCATSHVLANICKRFDCMYLRFPIVSACFPHAPPGFLERGARRPIWVGRIQGQFCLQRPLSVVRCRRWQRPITMGRPSRISGSTSWDERRRTAWLPHHAGLFRARQSEGTEAEWRRIGHLWRKGWPCPDGGGSRHRWSPRCCRFFNARARSHP